MPMLDLPVPTHAQRARVGYTYDPATTSPVEVDLLASLDALSEAANEAYGTPEFHVLARKFHALAEVIAQSTGVDHRSTGRYA